MDQRDNRQALRSLVAASGARAVADLCCYTGGFAINAAAGGAERVVGVDSSAPALALAAANAQLNDVAERCEFVRADVEGWMRQQPPGTFDVVVLDPPKLAPTRASLLKAVGKYKRLNRLAMALLRPGGLLLTCSCSGAVAQSGSFPQIVRAAAAEVGRSLAVLRTSGAAADHPLDVAFGEGAYLSCVLACVE